MRRWKRNWNRVKSRYFTDEMAKPKNPGLHRTATQDTGCCLPTPGRSKAAPHGWLFCCDFVGCFGANSKLPKPIPLMFFTIFLNL